MSPGRISAKTVVVSFADRLRASQLRWVRVLRLLTRSLLSTHCPPGDGCETPLHPGCYAASEDAIDPLAPGIISRRDRYRRHSNLAATHCSQGSFVGMRRTAPEPGIQAVIRTRLATRNR